jgi:transposase
MPAPLPDELRQRAVDAYLRGEGSYKEVAERFQVSHGSLEDWVRRYKRTGKVSAKEWKRGPTPRMDEEKQQALKRMVEVKNDSTLSELRSQLKKEGVEVSIATVCRTLLYKLRLTRKKKTSTPANGTAPTTKKNAKPSSRRSKTSRVKSSTFSTKRAPTSA